MTIKLHPVNHSGVRKNRYCGPSALSAITGLDTGETVALLRKVSGKASIKGTHNRWMMFALAKLGYMVTPVDDYDFVSAKECPTLHRWAKKREAGNGVYLVEVGHHWAVVQGRRYVCGMTGSIVPLKDSPKKKAKVRNTYLITRVEKVDPSTVIPPPPVAKPVDPIKREAMIVARDYQIHVEHDKETGVIWIHPPDILCDKEGVMDSDPFADEHYAYSWADALPKVEKYEELAKERLDFVEEASIVDFNET